MPGNGPMPKSDETRRRRNKPTFDLIVLPAEGYQGPIPEPLFPLRDEKRTLWEHTWRSPMAAQFRDDDVPSLTRMVSMQCDPDPSSADLTEIRQLEDRFGLNPAARRKLRWVIADEPAEEQATPDPSSGGRYEGMKVVV